MNKKKILLLISVFIFIILIGVIVWKLLPVKKISNVKYDKIEINYVALPYEGSDLLINEDNNLQFGNTQYDFTATDLKLTVDGKEVDKKTKAEAGKTYYFESVFEPVDGDLGTYIDENTKLIINTAQGTIPGTLTINGNEGIIKFKYTVKEEKYSPKIYTINCKANGVDYDTYYANENVKFTLFPLTYVPGFLGVEGVAELSRKNIGEIDVNGEKKRIFDSIIVNSNLEINYLFTDDVREPINDIEIKTNFSEKFKEGTKVSELKVMNELPKNVAVEFEIYEAEADPYDDNILVEDKLENKKYRIHGYLDYLDTDKTIDPDIKVTIDGKKVTNYYITKQVNSSTLAFIIEEEINSNK